MGALEAFFRRGRRGEGMAGAEHVWADGPVLLALRWLARMPADGKYGFATSSDDASFLMLDGKLVVDWPGYHGCVGDCRHNATVALGAGIHRFEYLHMSRGGTTCAVAAWLRPGMKDWEIIPEAAFAPLSRAEVGPMETLGGDVPCDFDIKISGEALIGARPTTSTPCGWPSRARARQTT